MLLDVAGAIGATVDLLAMARQPSHWQGIAIVVAVAGPAIVNDCRLTETDARAAPVSGSATPSVAA